MAGSVLILTGPPCADETVSIFKEKMAAGEFRLA
jgi:hypothetical protein